MKILNKFILTLLLFIPTFSYAHVRWFAQEAGYIRPYSITDTPVTIWILIALCIIAIGFYLEKKLNVPPKIHDFLEKIAPAVLSLASIGFGFAFIIFAYKGFIFSPNLVADNDLVGRGLLLLEGLAGAMMLFGVYGRIAGLFIVILFVFGIHEYGASNMIDTLEMLGFACYIMIIGRPKWKIIETNFLQKFSHRIHKYSYSILRIGTGLNLVVLGFTEKVLAPSLTKDFLAHYHWNFMQNALGFTQFTDYWFAFSAGMVEILFGIFFVLGLVTRTTTICLAVFLILTLAMLGPIELVGHLPHFSIAIVLLVLGSGPKMLLPKNS